MSKDNTIVKQEKYLPEAANSRGLPASITKDIRSTLCELQHEKIVSVFGQLFSGIQVNSDLLKKLDKTATYVAKIPKHLEKAFADGDLHFMVKSDTGENLGALVGTDKMNRGYVRIEEASLAVNNLAGSLANLAMQQQLAQIADIVNEVRSRVTELKVIHDHDLLGSLRGMHKQLNQIKDTRDLQTQKHLTITAITVLNETLGKVEQRLLDELERLPDAPKNLMIAYVKVFLTTGYLQKLEQGYELIQELFEYYLSGLQMLAYAYAFLEEDSVATGIFVPSKELYCNPNLVKMKKAEVLCADEKCDVAWYKAPEDYLQHISLEVRRILEADNEHLSIEITGEQLMEVLSNVEGTNS